MYASDDNFPKSFIYLWALHNRFSVSGPSNYQDLYLCDNQLFIFFTNISFVIGDIFDSENNKCFTPHVLVIPFLERYLAVLHIVHNDWPEHPIVTVKP